MILMPGPFVYAEPLDNDERKDQIRMLINKGKGASASKSP